ncbi:MAG: hypothetical protein L6Q55_01935 [Azonexus sp.]|nr:hypothetical protein [Azonexus sp.]MCK6411168.1 hypothetical protein [Azonexus sp.]
MYLRHLALLLSTLPLLASATTSVEKPADPPPATPKLAYGLLMKQGDKIVFSPCRDRSYALVDDISPDQTVTRGLNLVGLDQGKKLYVELVGSVEGIALKASGLNMARTDGRCQQPGGQDENWRAAGHEPGWLLAAGGERVTLKRQGSNDPVWWPYQEFKRNGRSASFSARSGGETLELQFEQQLCRDTTADAVFGWSATLTHNGKTLKGCAWQR